MTAHRRACCAQAAHPVAGRRRCQSHAPAATTSQHWPRSLERQPQPVGTIGPRRPPPPHARADPQNRLVPSLLASSPASSLNHNPRFKGILSDSVSCGKTLGGVVFLAPTTGLGHQGAHIWNCPRHFSLIFHANLLVNRAMEDRPPQRARLPWPGPEPCSTGLIAAALPIGQCPSWARQLRSERNDRARTWPGASRQAECTLSCKPIDRRVIEGKAS